MHSIARQWYQWELYSAIVWSGHTVGSVIVGFNRRKCPDVYISYYYSTPMTRQGNTTQYLIPLNVQPLLTACSADGVTLYSRSISTPSSPRSNQPALTSSRRSDDPVYSRTVAVVAAFSSTIVNDRCGRRCVAVTTVVVLNCPRHTV